MTSAEAKELIIAFGMNQTAITKAANTVRGIPATMERRERRLVRDLLKAITGERSPQRKTLTTLSRI